MSKKKVDLETLTNLAKRRGFFFLSSDVYDGFAGVYDYGPLGVEFVNNIKRLWWEEMVLNNTDIVGLDSGIVMHPSVWHASGHTTGFSDLCVVSSKTKKRYRLDHLFEAVGLDMEDVADEEEAKKFFEGHKDKLSIPGEDISDLGEPFQYNLLAESNIGSTDGSPTYLRGETCQGIYVNYKQVAESMRLQPPFGIAQIGKAFRNEISPRQFLFRTREFEQMEMQYFTEPAAVEETYEAFLKRRHDWLCSLGLTALRRMQHKQLVFYAKAAVDIEYEFPFGWGEMEGIHNRGNYDLTQHTEHSGVKLAAYKEETKEWFTPHVVETSIGVGRLALALLTEAYSTDEVNDESRVVLKLHSALAPVHFAILPLEKKHREQALSLFKKVRKSRLVQYDETQSIGKRYRRQDEIGTPCCITVDNQTAEDNTVTVRDRDTTEQKRIPMADIDTYIATEYPSSV